MCYSIQPWKLNENSIHCRNYYWNPDMNKAGHTVHTFWFSVKYIMLQHTLLKNYEKFQVQPALPRNSTSLKKRPLKKKKKVTEKFYIKPYVNREFYKHAFTWGGSVGELRGEQLFSSTLICSYVRFLTFLSPSKWKQTEHSEKYYFKHETEPSYTHKILTQSLPKLF